MIDIHCHLNNFPDFIHIANECEVKKIKTITMTNRPSEFKLVFPLTRKYKYVRAALGIHPLEVPFTKNELDLFPLLKKYTSYIGEVGLDFSDLYFNSKVEQINTFNFVLNCISNDNKILSIHSRKAEIDIIKYLNEYKIKKAIFHWYTGRKYLIDRILSDGYYFSINPQMTLTKKGKEIINCIPVERILVETDSPYVKIKNNIIKPSDVLIVYKYFARKMEVSINSIITKIDTNFNVLIKS